MGMLRLCQWRRDFPQKWRRKIPQSGGSWRSAVWVIGSSVFWRSATVFQGRRNGIGGGVRLEADRLGQQVGVLAQPIARPLDLDDDGVVKEPVEERGRDDGIAEDVAPLPAKPRFEVRIIAPFSYRALTSWKKRLPPPAVTGR